MTDTREDVLKEEIELMERLKEVAESLDTNTDLGADICNGWYETFVHFKKVNETALGETDQQFRDGLDIEKAQLEAFISVIDSSTEEGKSWGLAFQQDINFIEILKDLPKN